MTCMSVVCSTFLSHFAPNFKCSAQHPQCMPVTVTDTTTHKIIFLRYPNAVELSVTALLGGRLVNCFVSNCLVLIGDFGSGAI